MCVFSFITTLALYIHAQTSKLNAKRIFFSLQAIYNNCEEFHFSPKETAVCNQADHEIQQVSPFVTSQQLSTHPNTHIPRVVTN